MELAAIFQSFVVPSGLFLIMMGLGLTLSIDDILRVVVVPKAVLTGLTGQLILLPLLAFTIAITLDLAPEISIGLILLSACPGGITSNAYVFASRGDIALSVTLTSISSIFAIITMPLLTLLALSTFGEANEAIDFPISNMMKSLAKLTLLPIILGMSARKFQPEFAKKMVEPVRKMAFTILIIVIVGNTWVGWETIKANIVQAGLVALLLNVLCMCMGYGLARLTKLNTGQTISITYEVGVQNLSLALVLANTMLMMPEYAIFAIIYGFLMKFTALGFMAYARKLRTSDA